MTTKRAHELLEEYGRPCGQDPVSGFLYAINVYDLCECVRRAAIEGGGIGKELAEELVSTAQEVIEGAQERLSFAQEKLKAVQERLS